MQSWSDELIDRFAELWPDHGPSWEGWEDELGFTPSRGQMYYLASKLGIHRRRGPNPYSDEETRALVGLVDAFCKKYGRSFGSAVRKLDSVQTMRAHAERLRRRKEEEGEK